MSGHRRRNRYHDLEQMLFAPGQDGAPVFLRRISGAKGDRLVRDQKAIRYDDPETGRCLGYELLEHAPLPKVETKHAAIPGELPRSEAMFTGAEVEALQGFHGRSRTERMNEDERLKRIASGLPEMDLVESAKMKRKYWHAVR